MARLSALSATLVGVLFLGFAGCGGTGKKTAPEAGVSSGGTTPATGGQSSGGTVVVGSGGRGGAAGSGGLPGTGGAAGSGGTTATGGITGGGAAGSGGLSGTGGAAGSGGTIGGGGATGRGGTTATGGITGGGTGTSTGTMADAGVDGGKDAPAPGPDSASDLGPTSQCAGQGDFTPCVVVTTPDRKYDICVDGVCVSPGCGDSTCNAPGPHFPLADTDERTCSNGSTGTIACPASGQAYYGQDAQYGWDTLHPESERFTRSLSVASQPVVLDNVTGLTWQGCAAGRTDSDCATGQFATYTWQDAVAYCDALDWGGYQDWHLPDPYELDSMTDAGPTGFDTTAFPAASKNGNFYWSASSSADRSTDAWGGAGASTIERWDKGFNEFVRCVRGKAEPQPTRFTRNTSVATEPVVVDNVTGLTWQGCTQGLSGSDCTTGILGSHYWVDALSYCEGLSWGGSVDWRLPNWKELHSIWDDRLHDPAIDTSAFPATPKVDYFWSSTSDPGVCLGSPDYTCMGWEVDFQIGDASPNGSMSSSSMSGDSEHVRCVRGGP